MLGNPGEVFNTFTDLLQIVDGEISINIAVFTRGNYHANVDARNLAFPGYHVTQ